MKIKTVTASFYSENGFFSPEAAYYDLLDNIKNNTDITDLVSTNSDKYTITVNPTQETSYFNLLVQDYNNLVGVNFYLTLDAYYNMSFDKSSSKFKFAKNNELLNSNTLVLSLSCSTVYEDEQVVFDNSASIRRELYPNLVNNDFNYKIAVIYYKYVENTEVKEAFTFTRYNIISKIHEKFLGDIVEFQSKIGLNEIIEQLNNPGETYENLQELNAWITTIDALSESEALVLALRDDLIENYRNKFLA